MSMREAITERRPHLPGPICPTWVCVRILMSMVRTARSARFPTLARWISHALLGEQMRPFRRWSRNGFAVLSVLIVIDNWGLANTTEEGRISSHIPGPGVADSGLLAHGGTLYILWCIAAAVYVIAIWGVPSPPWHASSVLQTLLRLVGSLVLVALIGLTTFLLLLPGGSG
jgi:hypothetical protein